MVLFLDVEERSIEDEKSFEEDSVEEEVDTEGDGHNTTTQTKLGLDIIMIGARKENLGKSSSQTKEMSSPMNESMERADLTMEDWIQETCLISALTSGSTEPKTFQEAWHTQLKMREIIGELLLGRKSGVLLKEGFGEKQIERGYPATEDLLEIIGYSRSKEMALTGRD